MITRFTLIRRPLFYVAAHSAHTINGRSTRMSASAASVWAMPSMIHTCTRRPMTCKSQATVACDSEFDTCRGWYCLPPIHKTTIMSSTSGVVWVDIEGAHEVTSAAARTPKSDAEFVMAMRDILLGHGVHPSLLATCVGRVVLLPTTIVATDKKTKYYASERQTFGFTNSLSPFGTKALGSGQGAPRDVCFICRFARVEGHASGAASFTRSRASSSNEGEPSVDNGRVLAPVIGAGIHANARNSPITPRSIWGGIRSFRFLDSGLRFMKIFGWNALLKKGRRLQGVGDPLASRSSLAGSSKGEEKIFESIQQLSSRLTVFILPEKKTIVTVHRYHIRSIHELKHEWNTRMRRVSLDGLLRKFVVDCAQTFLDMERIRAMEVDVLEERLFATAPATSTLLGRARHALFKKPDDRFRESLEVLYAFSREASAYCRILQPLLRAYEEARVASQGNTKNIDLVEHRIAAAISMCEGLREQTQSLLSLQFSVGAGQLEELFRLLTVFSTIFIPLEFLASLGGAEVGFVKLILDNNDISLGAVSMLFALVLALTLQWLRKIVF